MLIIIVIICSIFSIIYYHAFLTPILIIYTYFAYLIFLEPDFKKFDFNQLLVAVIIFFIGGIFFFDEHDKMMSIFMGGILTVIAFYGAFIFFIWFLIGSIGMLLDEFDFPVFSPFTLFIACWNGILTILLGRFLIHLKINIFIVFIICFLFLVLLIVKTFFKRWADILEYFFLSVILFGLFMGILWSIGKIAKTDCINWQTAQLIFVIVVLLGVIYLLYDIILEKEVWILGLVLVGLILGTFNRLYVTAKQPIILTSQKKVSKEIEQKEVKELSENSEKINAVFKKQLATIPTFKHKSIQVKDPLTGKTETITPLLDYGMGRVGNTDTVAAFFGITIQIQAPNPNLPKNDVFETEFLDYCNGCYLVKESIMTRALLDAVKVSIDTFSVSTLYEQK